MIRYHLHSLAPRKLRMLLIGFVLAVLVATSLFGSTRMLRGSLTDDAVLTLGDTNQDGIFSVREMRKVLTNMIRAIALQNDLSYDLNASGTVDRTDLTILITSIRAFLGAECGDGTIQAGEQCDDDNVNNNDGCSAVCRIEAKFCGDGVFENTSGIEWTKRNAVNADWVQVAYGNGIFVALSKFGGDIMTSPDGISWTRHGQNEGAYFSGITYGKGLFVAVSTTTGVMTSPDGLTWTKRTINSSNLSWSSITYGKGTFVAVSHRGYIMSSNNGMNWVAQEISGVWRDVAYGNGVFVSVNDDNEALTSPDGITWTKRRIDDGANRFWNNITYGNNTFVLTSVLDKIATSSDGITWAIRSLNIPDIYFVDIVYGKGAFVGIMAEVAAGGGGEIQRSITSLDGITWTKGRQLYDGLTWAQGNDLYGNLRSIAYGNGLFVAVGKFDSAMVSGKYGFFGNDITNENSEQCDDGNANNDDGCSNTCKLPTCGDTIVQGLEQCDDGNDVNTDACTNSCRVAMCTDGFVQSGEQCDDGNQIDTDSCNNQCKNTSCGDTIIQGHEQCDDGNLIETDGCNNYCEFTSCPDGIVQNPNGLGRSEQCDDGNSFDTDFCTNTCTTSCGNGIFEPMREYVGGNIPPYPITFANLDNTIAFADVNGDGLKDKVQANVHVTTTRTISVYLAYGPGMYSAPTTHSLGDFSPSAVAIGDLNGDSKKDIAVANGPNRRVSVFWGNGQGGFTMHSTSFPTDKKPESILIADVNGDGVNDVVTANQGYYGQTGGKNVSVILGTGMGAFAPSYEHPTTRIPKNIFSADLNQDGKADLITFNIGNSVTVLLGTGLGNFSDPTLYRTMYSPSAVAIADFNSDGRIDIATQRVDAGVDAGITVLLGKVLGSCSSGT